VEQELAEGYVELLAEVSVTSGRLQIEQLASRRALGAAAAERGVALSNVIADCLAATWRAWPELPGVRAARDPGALNQVAPAVLRAVQDATVAVVEGYESGQRSAIRREEAARREFIDDLLHGRADLGQLADRAERFGLRLVGPHRVAVAATGKVFTEGDPATRYVEEGMAARFGTRDVLITAMDGLLVCVATDSVPDAPRGFADHVHHAAHQPGRVAVSRPHPGPSGIVRSYQEARNALDMAVRLGLPGPLLDASDLLVFQVIGRDRVAITDLVATVLGPLARARGGARPLLETLNAYFSAGCVTAATARALGLSVRAITYRLSRIGQLTGYDPTEPDQRYTLQTAAVGARLLDWPTQPLTPET
jgi:sugar diacid utilization regulator